MARLKRDEKCDLRFAAPEGASDFGERAASLKRCPDTKRELAQIEAISV
jgi:hypothetical protein